MSKTKQELRQHRHWRIRTKIHGTAERPRMCVCFSERNIHVQFIDDLKGITLVSVSTIEEAFKKNKKNRANVSYAVQVGKLAAERALSQQIKKVVFDRAGSLYHGKVKALADAAREAGLVF